jgi:RNA polymerase sigma-70 factor (ECF subfamily)
MQHQSCSPTNREGTVAVFDAALPEVYRYVLHRCRDRATAEDITADTFLSAVATMRRGNIDIITVAWLIGIARHKLIDHWRQLERNARHLASVDGPGGAADPLVEEIEPGRGLEVLAELSAAHRAALTLRYVDGLSVSDVAATLGRSVHSTETLLMRAKAAFRRAYLDRSDDDG